MPEGIDGAERAFAAEVAPEARPRDAAGRFASVSERPESMFAPRAIEGDPVTGDTRDGGDDQRLRALEREHADGRSDPWERERAENRQNLRRSTGNAVDNAETIEQEDLWANSAEDATDLEGGDLDAGGSDEVDGGGADADGTSLGDAEGGQRFEVTVDGQKQEITLAEALRGYVRQATFHQRLQQLNEIQRQVDEEAGRLQAGWQMWHKARAEYEQDLASMIPKEPDWRELSARDPGGAWQQRQIFETLYGKLNQSRQMRAAQAQADREELDRRTHKYAVDGFSKFVMDNIKWLPDEPTLQKNIQSMRRTAAAAGFSEYEVATVYDPRMLTILLKASKYDRMTASRPKAVEPGKGRTLTPGAAMPLGSARRKGFDEAQRRLAQTGHLDDATEVFKRFVT